jgi:hypothetical protein
MYLGRPVHKEKKDIKGRKSTDTSLPKNNRNGKSHCAFATIST